MLPMKTQILLTGGTDSLEKYDSRMEEVGAVHHPFSGRTLDCWLDHRWQILLAYVSLQQLPGDFSQ